MYLCSASHLCVPLFITGRLPDFLPGRWDEQSPAGAAPPRGLPRPERLEVAQDFSGEDGPPCT